VAELAGIAALAGRPVRQRTTTYVGTPEHLTPAAPRLLPLTTA